MHARELTVAMCCWLGGCGGTAAAPPPPRCPEPSLAPRESPSEPAAASSAAALAPRPSASLEPEAPPAPLAATVDDFLPDYFNDDDVRRRVLQSIPGAVMVEPGSGAARLECGGHIASVIEQPLVQGGPSSGSLVIGTAEGETRAVFAPRAGGARYWLIGCVELTGDGRPGFIVASSERYSLILSIGSKVTTIDEGSLPFPEVGAECLAARELFCVERLAAFFAGTAALAGDGAPVRGRLPNERAPTLRRAGRHACEGRCQVRGVILLLVLAGGCSSAPPPSAPARCPEPAVATAEAPAAVMTPSAGASAVAAPSPDAPEAGPLEVAPLPTEALAPTAPSDPSLAPEGAPFGPLKDHPDLLVFREQDATGQCGAFVVGPPVDGPLGVLQIREPDGTLVAQLRPSIGIDSYLPSACGDLTGDGTVERIVSYSTGGAHCCHTDVVLELGEPPRVLLAMDMADGGYAYPLKLRPGKGYQLVSRDMLLAGASLAVPCAGDPGFPKALDRNGQRFVDRTRRFPAFVAAEPPGAWWLPLQGRGRTRSSAEGMLAAPTDLR